MPGALVGKRRLEDRRAPRSLVKIAAISASPAIASSVPSGRLRRGIGGGHSDDAGAEAAHQGVDEIEAVAQQQQHALVSKAKPRQPGGDGARAPMERREGAPLRLGFARGKIDVSVLRRACQGMPLQQIDKLSSLPPCSALALLSRPR